MKKERGLASVTSAQGKDKMQCSPSFERVVGRCLVVGPTESEKKRMLVKA